MTVTDYPDYATPQAHADKIAATGVPLLAKSVNLINDVNHSIAVGTTVSLGPVTVTQIGYEIEIEALTTGASITNILTVEMKWTDSVTGKLVAHETWNFPQGSTGVGTIHVGTGPTKADTLRVNLTNNDSVVAATVSTVLSQNSRVYNRDDWRTETFGTVPNFAVPTHDQQGGVLAGFLSGSLGANGSVTRTLPLYSGRVLVSFWSTVSLAGQLSIVVQDPTFTNALYANLNIQTGSNFSNVLSLSLPRSFCTFQLQDKSGSAGNILTAWFVIDEYLP